MWTTAMPGLRQWAVSRPGPAPTGRWTWQETCGSGWLTGTTMATTAARQTPILKDQIRRSFGWFGAARGSTIMTGPALPVATGSTQTSRTTAAGFGVVCRPRLLSKFWILISACWVLVPDSWGVWAPSATLRGGCARGKAPQRIRVAGRRLRRISDHQGHKTARKKKACTPRRRDIPSCRGDGFPQGRFGCGASVSGSPGLPSHGLSGVPQARLDAKNLFRGQEVCHVRVPRYRFQLQGGDGRQES